MISGILNYWKPLGWCMNCENPTFPAEAGGQAGEQRPVIQVSAVLCVQLFAVFGLCCVTPIVWQVWGTNILKHSVKSFKIYQSQGGYCSRFRVSWELEFHPCPLPSFMDSKRLKKSQSKIWGNRNHNKTSHNRRLCLWCAAILEPLGISVLCWSQQFQSCRFPLGQHSSCLPAWQRSQSKNQLLFHRTSCVLGSVQGRAWLPWAGLISFPCSVLGNKLTLGNGGGRWDLLLETQKKSSLPVHGV